MGFSRSKKSRKARRLTRHHITAKTNGGNNHRSNIIMLWRDRHSYWHALFGNRSLEEIIEVLLRLKKFKDRQGRGHHGNVVPLSETLQNLIDSGYHLPNNSMGEQVRGHDRIRT